MNLGKLRAVSAALVLSCALVFHAGLGQACDCARVEPANDYLPFAGSEAPPNVVPRVLLHYGHASKPDDWLLDLRLLCSVGGESKVHETDLTRARGFRMGMLELKPRRPLPQGATCGLVERDGNVVNWFTVTKETDTTAPAAPKIRGGRFASGVMHQCGPQRAAGGLRIEEDPEAPEFKNQVYATWLGVEGQPPNYEDPPLTASPVDRWSVKPTPYTDKHTPPLNFDLSANYGCSPANFPYPQKGSVTLGIKVVDLAGNWSEPAEVTLRGVAANALEKYEFGLDDSPNHRIRIVMAVLVFLALLVAAVVARDESDAS